MVQHEELGQDVFNIAELQVLNQIGSRRLLFIRQAVEHADGDTPAFYGRDVAAGLSKGLDGAQAGKAAIISLKKLAAPNRTIRTIAGTVKGNADNRLRVIVLRHTGDDMGVMMLYRQHRQAFSFT